MAQLGMLKLATEAGQLDVDFTCFDEFGSCLACLMHRGCEGEVKLVAGSLRDLTWKMLLKSGWFLK